MRNKDNILLGSMLCVLAAIALAGCAATEQPDFPAAVEELAPGILEGYLTTEELPNSLALLPEPPVGRDRRPLHETKRLARKHSPSTVRIVGKPHSRIRFSISPRRLTPFPKP